jgi:polar amino acid transport system permease protein
MSGVAPTTPPELLGSRNSRLLGKLRPGGVVIATLSTLLVFGVIGYLIVTAPGWKLVQQTFFNPDYFWPSFAALLPALVKNIELFLIAEVFILFFGLLLAVMRSLPGPAFFPFRLMSVFYIDLFRGIPSILVIFLIGFGVPALGVPGVLNDPFFLGLLTLVIVWSAYVAEVYRAGLSRLQGLRFVVLPQAVRRVVPPLLNDFIGLQKDTALVSFIGVIEVFRRTQIIAGGSFNFTPYLACGLIFLLLTIPLARFVDWLAARDRKRQLATIAR